MDRRIILVAAIGLVSSCSDGQASGPRPRSFGVARPSPTSTDQAGAHGTDEGKPGGASNGGTAQSGGRPDKGGATTGASGSPTVDPAGDAGNGPNAAAGEGGDPITGG